ncbi:flagellar filament capping protein FliD [Aeromonas schubertii]|uniref:Flagellar hook-associated protein 2 n=1 Tax=Aeromonas schubertii TaxID=652 RepID=A0A0S2SP30_9GAMM|nr:flagellar filament capping protein FliD [Aeromonas schubertii]ALP43436.1 LafB [Aeromonas schubertii]
MMVDPVTMATQLVAAERMNMDKMLKRQQEAFKAQLEAINGLNTKLSAFQTQLKELNKASTLQAQKATASEEGFMTITSDGKAVSGEYSLSVKQLAQAHQVDMVFTSENDPLPTSGELKLTVAGKEVSIDFATLPAGSTVKDLVSQINNAPGNDKVKASLMRSDGKLNLVLTSRESGTANAIDVQFSGDPASTFGQAVAARKDVTLAQDAKVTMGSGPGAIEVVSASNKLDKLIDGLTIDLTKAQKPGEAPLRISVTQDKETVTGALASDSSVRSLKSVLTRSVRDLPNGMSLAQLGIKTDRHSKLTLDETAFNKALEKDPELLGKALLGDDGLLKRMSNAIDPYTARDGIFKRSKESIEKSQKRVDQKMEALDRRMDAAYKRYLNQFTVMNQMLQTMQGI